MKIRKSIAIIGGGPSALMLACSLDPEKYDISLYEKNAALGRKFLVAGKGGFNLTHAEAQGQFEERYTPKAWMQPFLRRFSSTDLRAWLSRLGIETYIGTSKRVFPVKGTKPVEVLKAIEKKLSANSVPVHYQHVWKGWENDALMFQRGPELITLKPDLVVFALGGASWKVTGSDGHWTGLFKEKHIALRPFLPSNCAYKIHWEQDFIKKHAGNALKNCTFDCGEAARKGEAVLTEFGIEGSGVYPLSPAIRRQLAEQGQAQLSIDLKPDLELKEIIQRLQDRGNLSVKDVLVKKLHLTSVQTALLKCHTSKEAYHDPEQHASAVKHLMLTVTGLAPLDEAISTVGGIDLSELTEHLELKKLPQHYCLGEMIDWDAPTGGYLLQACFSMGFGLAEHLNAL